MAAGKIFAISFALNAMMGASFSSTMSRGAAVMQSLNAKTSALNAEQKRLDREWQNSQNAVRGYAREMQRIQQQYDQGKISQSQYQSSMDRIKQSMSTAGMSASEYRAHLQRLKQEMDQVSAAAARMQAAQAAKTAAGANLSSAWAGMQSAVVTAGMVAAPLVGAVETAANFEAAMSKVKAITQTGLIQSGQINQANANMQALTAQARKLGETTQFSATQAAEAMSYLGMAGWNTEQIIGGMPGLLSLAAASGTDLARAADIVSDDLTAFGLTADDASHMADVFAVTVTRTNTTVEMLGQTMKYAAPVAKAFGASMEETAAMAGLMANAGIKSSQAGTTLRAGFLRLAGPPKKSRKAMEELGISMSDAMAQQEEARAALNDLGIDMDSFSGTPAHKMVAVLNEIRNKTQNLTGEQKLATMQAIFGTEAATGWLSVIEAGPAAFDDLVASMENSKGAAEEMAKIMMDNAKGSWVQLKSAVEGLAISIGTIFLPALTAGGKQLAEMAGSASQWVQENEGLVKGIAEVAMGLTTAFVGFRAYRLGAAAIQYVAANTLYYVEILKNTTIGSKLLTAAMQRQGQIMTALRGAFDASMYRNFANSAVAAYTRMRAITWADIGARMRAALSFGGGPGIFSRALVGIRAFKAGLISAITGIPGKLANLGRTVMTMWRAFSFASVLKNVVSGFRVAAVAIRAFGAASMSFAFSPLGIALIAIAGAAMLIYQNWGTVGPFFMSLWQQIQTAFTNAWAMIQPAIAQFWQACVNLGTAVAPVLESLWQTVQAAWAQITAVFAENQGTIDTVISIFTMLAEVVGVVLVGAFVGFVSMSVGVLTAWVGMIASVITGAIGILTGIIDFITGVFTGNWSQAWQGVLDIFSSIFNMLAGIANSVLGGIMNTVNSIANAVKSIHFGGGGGQQIAANAQGGIYRKGAFLTTFAEDSAEAAIPLDGSPRAIGLWQKAGEILGVGQKNAPVRQRVAIDEGAAAAPSGITMPPITINVNVYGDNDPGDIRRAVLDAGHKFQKSFAEQMAEFNHERGRLSFG